MAILPGKDPIDYNLSDVFKMIDNVRNVALEIAGGLAVFLILLGGFYYITAYGNEERAKKGKMIIIWTIVGIGIIMISGVAVAEVIKAMK